MNTDEPLIDTRDHQQAPTLRDQFAMAVISIVIETCVDDHRQPNETHEELFAKRAYQIADAMLAERAK